MVQLYEQMPPELGLGDGMYCIDTGDYCKAWDAQRLLNTAMAQVQFLRVHAPNARGKHRAWNNYTPPPELHDGIIYSNEIAYCVARDAQRLLDRIRTEIVYWGSHIPDVGCARETWNNPVRC